LKNNGSAERRTDHRVKQVLARRWGSVGIPAACGTIDEFVKAAPTGAFNQLQPPRAQAKAAGSRAWALPASSTTSLRPTLPTQIPRFRARGHAHLRGDPAVRDGDNELCEGAKHGALSSPDAGCRNLGSRRQRCSGDTDDHMARAWRTTIAASGPIRLGLRSSAIAFLTSWRYRRLTFPSDGACCKIEIPLERRRGSPACDAGAVLDCSDKLTCQLRKSRRAAMSLDDPLFEWSSRSTKSGRNGAGD